MYMGTTLYNHEENWYTKQSPSVLFRIQLPLSQVGLPYQFLMYEEV